MLNIILVIKKTHKKTPVIFHLLIGTGIIKLENPDDESGTHGLAIQKYPKVKNNVKKIVAFISLYQAA